MAWALFAVLIGWSVACAAAYLQGYGRRPAWVIAEVVVVAVLVLSTEFVASDQWMADNQSWPTTLWATNATISAAILLGPVAGMAAGAVVMLSSAALKGYVTFDFGRNATIVVELAVGLAIGLAAQTARRAHAELEEAARLAASLEERERLSREVHDGAIQVLALVARRGREIGGPTGELAELAGEQERALRRLVSSGATASPAGGAASADLVALLRARESDRVSMSLPATPVPLSTSVAAEVDAAVANALDNVVAHAGPRAHAFVLLEDLGDSVVVSIRDDGLGHSRWATRSGGRRGPRRRRQIDCGKDELVGRQCTAQHRARHRHRVGTGRSEAGCARWPTLEREYRVMVVDDHPIWRDAVARDLAEEGFDVVATADGVASARRRAAVVTPDVVVMDMRLSDGTGAMATAEVLAVSPSSRILVLSASDERDDVLEAVKAGATGYLVKSASKVELAEAVRATAEGRAVFTPGLAGLVLGEYRRMARTPDAGSVTPSLTERETEILRYVAKGLTAKQIAERLVVEPPHRREPRADDVPEATGGQSRRAGPLRHRARPRRGVRFG